MVYINSWDEFAEKTVALFRADPESTRYVLKYRHVDGKLVLKVTDNKQCLKFKTDQAQDMKKMEKLNNLFFTLMSRGPERYDPDPAAKAAAASVLASKLGADSGLKVYLGDESNNNVTKGTSSDVELMETSGLRQRKQVQARSSSQGSTLLQQPNEVALHDGVNSPGVGSTEPNQQLIVEHFRGQEDSHEGGGWIDRIIASLVGDNPRQSYALICGNCHMHNGLAKEEEYPYITYYCPHCRALNRSNKVEEPISGEANLALSPVKSSGEVSSGSSPVSETTTEVGREKLASGNSVAQSETYRKN